MSTLLPLDKMTIEQKLQALEELTVDLHRNEALIPTPQWHLDVLNERGHLVHEGKEKCVDVESFKKLVEEEILRRRTN